MGGVSNALGPSSTLGSLGSSHQWLRKSWTSPRSPPYAHGVAGTPQGEVYDTHPHQMESMPSSTIFVVGTPILKSPSSLDVTLCFLLGRYLHNASSIFGKVPKVFLVHLVTLEFTSKELIYHRPTYFETTLPFGPPKLGSASLILFFLLGWTSMLPLS